MVARRKLEDERRKQRAREDRRGHVRRILQHLRLWDRFSGTNLQKNLLDCFCPSITVEPAANLPQDDRVSALLKEAKKAAAQSTFSCPLLGEQFSVQEYWAFVHFVIKNIHQAATSSPKMGLFLQSVREQTDDLNRIETTRDAFRSLICDLDKVLIRFGEIDTQLYYVKCEFGRTPSGKPTAKCVVHREEAQKLWVEPKGEKGRMAFRCGQPFGKNGIDWIEWPRSLLGRDNSGASLPVYVQSHALDDLYRKEARALFVEDGEWMVHDYLWQSLRTPVIKPMAQSPGKFLVEYYFGGHKIGYLVAQPLEEMVLIRSFLFLTMNGTPEGDLLWKKRRLCREDKEELELDRIKTFLLTDIQFNPTLVHLLEECGCGHLFKIMKEPPCERTVASYARNMLKYLKLDGQ
jgi:hypothetical protein